MSRWDCLLGVVATTFRGSVSTKYRLVRYHLPVHEEGLVTPGGNRGTQAGSHRSTRSTSVAISGAQVQLAGTVVRTRRR